MSTPWWFFLIAAGLIVMSGFFSGLNLGLMSLAPDELKVVMEGSADEQAKRDAAKIYPLRKRGNLLLCTLLLGNTLVNALIAVLRVESVLCVACFAIDASRSKAGRRRRRVEVWDAVAHECYCLCARVKCKR
ncbi:unnamed protein product [Pelagomonas calceolata]|uniref:CNNM transmembrane domain-containing protein n=1 Tax=Pelagomonas calceolata TaxID=35677 RepID=A0A8J2SA44_9STRA|nr:unnamed protein product [Pelagomonas calceolata]